ncbi:MAG: hypothetical protein IKC01_08245 [Clostridia bacterium]|nr:hypothetical protein [Clostridia bacterium]
MIGFIKVKTKEKLLNNTLKLFMVSLTSFLIKSALIISMLFLTHFSLVSDILQSLLLIYNRLIVYFIYSLIIVSLWFFTLLFISGIKMGEKAIYFMQSKGSNAKFKYLFIFLRPSQSFRALQLFLKITILKVFWALFAFAPPAFCLSITLSLYFKEEAYAAVIYTLIIGTVFLTSISCFFYNCCKARYLFAEYYLCTDFEISVKEALRKSIDTSQGFIREGVLLRASLFPWILICLLLIPVFYVIPYTKLTNAKFVTFSSGLKENLLNIRVSSLLLQNEE